MSINLSGVFLLVAYLAMPVAGGWIAHRSERRDDERDQERRLAAESARQQKQPAGVGCSQHVAPASAGDQPSVRTGHLPRAAAAPAFAPAGVHRDHGRYAA